MQKNNKIKEQISSALGESKYDYRKVIIALKEIQDFRKAYLLLNSKKRSYSLEDHTIMVCQMFEKYFSTNYTFKEFGIESFRLLLCLHDIGKPYSLKNNEKEKQWQYTVELIQKYRDMLPFSKRDYPIAIALISDDPLGLYIRGKIGLEDAIARIRDMASTTKLPIQTFMNLLTIYYQVDSGAYTHEGYIGDEEAFTEKPKLEAVFQKDENGKLLYSSDKCRLVFSQFIEIRFYQLMEGLHIYHG